MIQDRAMLVSLTMCKWSAVKNDKAASNLVEITNQAHNAGKYSKNLIDKHHLAVIDKLIGEIRRYHYSRTYAWGDNGQRLLPSALFMDYRDEMARYKQLFHDEVNLFVKNYPAMVQAARTRLNLMYDPLDYPDAADIQAKFDISLEIMPVPDSDDFRVSVSEETRDEIRTQITERVNSRIVEANKQCWERVHQAVSLIARTCGDETARLHESLMSNTESLLGLLPGLNITNDPELTAIEKDIRALITPIDNLRKSPHARAVIAQRAEEILATIEMRS